jgi:GNAT superfamily N-acetyltransferase
MEMITKIKEISAEQTLYIRHNVMWPNKSIDYVKLPNDSKGKHFGLFLNDNLISVVSLFIENNEAQFRKFATLTEYQGKGYGSELLKEIIIIARTNNVDRLWCNARADKISYYEKFGMNSTDDKFEKGGLDFVILEKLLKSS